MQSEHDRTAAPFAPPVTAAPLSGEPRSSWPTVLGVIAIVFGAIGLLNGCGSVAGLLFFDFMERVMPDEEDAAQLRAMRPWLAFVIASAIAGMLLGGMLIAGSIGLLMRRRWGVTACLTWAVLKIVYELAIIVPSYQMQIAQSGAIATDDPAMAGFPGLFETFAIVGIGAGLLFGMALPVFMVIWLSRSTIRSETAQWL